MNEDLGYDRELTWTADEVREAIEWALGDRGIRVETRSEIVAMTLEQLRDSR